MIAQAPLGIDDGDEIMNHTLTSDGFDPTGDEDVDVMVPFHNAMVGKAPSGFIKIRVEMKPHELLKIIGYDPRGIQPIRKGAKLIEPSRNVSQALVDLQREVQRSIYSDKIQEMVEYLHAAVSNNKYADWSELDVVTTAQPDTARFKTEHLILLPTAAEYFIIDGQHRYCALIDFIRFYPELARNFTQAVAISVMQPEQIREWAGQGFHDKNYLRTAVKATKALAVDHRDAHNVLAKLLHNHPVIEQGGGVNEEKDSLAASSNEMVTHAVLYKFVRGFCEGRRGLDKGSINKPHLSPETFEDLKKHLFSYVSDLGEALPTWTDPTRRAEYLFRASPAWQALGVIGHLLMDIDDEDERRQYMAKLNESNLNWRRENLDWESIIGNKQHELDTAGLVVREWVSPRASRQAIDGTITFLKKRLGLDTLPELKDQEEQSI